MIVNEKHRLVDTEISVKAKDWFVSNEDDIFTTHLFKLDEFFLGRDVVDGLIEKGYARFQLIDGEEYIKLYPSFFSTGSELAIEFPYEFSKVLWNMFCEEIKKKLTLEEAFIAFCGLHSFMKSFTSGEVDFATEIGKLLLEKRMYE